MYLIASTVAALCTLIGVVLLGVPSRSGWYFSLLGNVLWMGCAFVQTELALFVLNLVLFFAGIYGLVSWTTKASSAGT